VLAKGNRENILRIPQTLISDTRFPNVNSPFICSSISTALVYGVSINSIFEGLEKDIIFISGVANKI